VISDSKSNQKLVEIGIIGAGAAGLTAGLTAARYGFHCIIFESKTAGGRAGGIPYIESYPGLGKVKGVEFMKTLKAQTQLLKDLELHEFEPVKELRIKPEHFQLITDKNEYNFRFVILAMGAEHKHLNVTGESDFKGRGVSYCAACDGLFFKNKNTIVIGNDTHAIEQALFLNELDSNVTLINPGSNWNVEHKLYDDLQSTSVKILENATIDEIYGERLVSGVRVSSEHNSATMDHNELEAKGVFISIGLEPRTDLVSELAVNLNDDGFLNVDDKFKTNIPNLYAVGDLTDADLELVSVCASGANAIKNIIKENKL
jgi:thioredoxin reductase (NADPH)